MRFLLFFSGLLFLSSCADFFEQELPDPDVDFEPRLVLYALLSPRDTQLFVDVRRTVPAFGPRPDGSNFRRQVEDALVVLDDGQTQYELPFDRISGQQGYTLSTAGLDLQPGRSYTITATHEGLTASGTTVIPRDSTDVRTLTAELETEQQGAFRERQLFLSLPNPAPERERYYVLIHDRVSDSGNNVRVERELIDFLRTREGFGPRIDFTPVRLSDGPLHTVNVCTTDRATYDYFATRQVGFNNQDNPFAEPTEVSGNVSGGLGLVGGLNCRAVMLR